MPSSIASNSGGDQSVDDKPVARAQHCGLGLAIVAASGIGVPGTVDLFSADRIMDVQDDLPGRSGFQPTGRRVAELRRRGGFSVPEFAGLLRVSASTVYRWEAARGPLALRAGQEDALQVLYREIEKRQTE